jgi:hypothetical protein
MAIGLRVDPAPIFVPARGEGRNFLRRYLPSACLFMIEMTFSQASEAGWT